MEYTRRCMYRDSISGLGMYVISYAELFSSYQFIAVFSGYRTYALSRPSKLLAILVFVLTATFIIPDVVSCHGFDACLKHSD